MTSHASPHPFRTLNWLLTGLLAGTSVAALSAASSKINPIGKLYVATVGGSAQITSAQKVEDLTRKTVHSIAEAVIETRKTSDSSDKKEADFSSMVYSNGTGIYFDPDTRLEVQKFVQEPFTPNRTDMDVEPSVSQTYTMLSRGMVGLCTSQMVAGSSMVYQTPLGAINVRGRKIVIESNAQYTRVAMLEGESTVRAGTGGNLELGGRILRAGEQAFIRPGAVGQSPTIQIERIPQNDLTLFEGKVAQACLAKRMVYFEAVSRSTVAGTESAATAEKGEVEAAGTGDGTAGPLTAFDSGAAQEIIAVEVVPVDLPVQYTVSPARVLP